MSFHFAPPQTGWALQRDGSCVPFGEVDLHEGFGPDPVPPAPPPDHQLPAWALVGIVGAVCAVVGVAIYYKYKLTSEIAAKHGIGKALAFEAGTEAIGVVGSRLRRNSRRDPPRGYRYRYIPGHRPGEGHLVLEQAPPGWKPSRTRPGKLKKLRVRR